ncbi:hypothetical protein, partial [Neisseria viridiae]|uniref:hypothetical protein n=1 Tax=Neisseria viridiae TaxID=2830648 RepID=UPI00272B8959
IIKNFPPPPAITSRESTDGANNFFIIKIPMVSMIQSVKLRLIHHFPTYAENMLPNRKPAL